MSFSYLCQYCLILSSFSKNKILKWIDNYFILIFNQSGVTYPFISSLNLPLIICICKHPGIWYSHSFINRWNSKERLLCMKYVIDYRSWLNLWIRLASVSYLPRRDRWTPPFLPGIYGFNTEHLGPFTQGVPDAIGLRPRPCWEQRLFSREK